MNLTVVTSPKHGFHLTRNDGARARKIGRWLGQNMVLYDLFA